MKQGLGLWPKPRQRQSPLGTSASESGFTLLEALIAFAIAALALGVLFQGTGAALRTTAAATRLEGAVERARSHLAEAGALIGGSGERVEVGEDGALYHWLVRITPSAQATGQRPGLANPIRLYRIEVEETWSERGHPFKFRLHSERLFVGPARTA